MTTSTDHSTDTFETVQHYDEPTRLSEVLTEHMLAAMEQGVRGDRIYHVRSNGAATDWVISCEPVTQARQPAILFEPKEDFPCCSAKLCHTCGGTGTVKQRVYSDRAEPHTYGSCGDCGGTGGHEA